MRNKRVWLFLLATLAATGSPMSLMDETVQVPASGWRSVQVLLRQRTATVVCAFTTAPPRSVRVALMRIGDVRHLEAGRPHRVLVATPYRASGAFRYAVGEPGEYAIVVDNRLDARGPADVRLRVLLDFGRAVPEARVLSPARRLSVVVLSLSFFVGVTCWSGRLLLRAIRAQRTPGPPPPSE
jgi:hypothetical protein